MDVAFLTAETARLFTCGLASGLTPAAARQKAYEASRAQVAPPASDRVLRRCWAQVPVPQTLVGADEEFVLVEGVAVGAASVEELEALLHEDVVEGVLCPKGHGRYELSDCGGKSTTACDFTYGSSSAALVARLVDLGRQHGSKSSGGLDIVDLGSGSGVALAAAAARGGCRMCTGAELFLQRHLAAVDLMRHLAHIGQLRCSVQLIRGSFLEPNLILTHALQHVHVVFVNNCTFSEWLNEQMCQGPLRCMPIGSVAVTLASLVPKCSQVRVRKPIERLGFKDLPVRDSSEEAAVIFLDPLMSKADTLTPRLEHVCVDKVPGGLGWTNTDASLFVYRRAGGP